MGVSNRLSQLSGQFAASSSLSNNTSMAKVQSPDQLPWDPNCTQFPSRRELPKLEGAPDGAAWVWGKDDQLGRLNLLTPQRVKAAAAEILTGEMVRLDLPLNVPETPAFGREKFQHNIKCLIDGIAYDDTYALNTQSGTQWDGFRHFAHIESKTFYNGTKSTDILGPKSNTHACSTHHWATHGIASRGILLDYRHYAHTHNIPYDPYTQHAISYADLQACAQSQGLDLRPASQGGDIRIGDILMIRSGFVERYNELSEEERRARALRTHDDAHWAGLKQEDAILDFLHDGYFAAVVGDSPTFECWPPLPPSVSGGGAAGGGGYLHESILALWGMPLGEMWDLERLAERCRGRGRWTFFVTSAPGYIAGGVGSHGNATAIL